MAEKKLYGSGFGPYLYDDSEDLDDPDGDFPSMTWDASISDGYHICAGVRFLDTDQTNHLTLSWDEDDSTDRTLKFLVGEGNRSVTLNEDFVIADGYNVTIQALGQANQLTLNEAFTIGDGSAGTLTYSSVCTLTVELASVLNQDLTTDASPTFANVSLGTGELTAGSVNRASGSLTLEVGGVAQATIATTGLTVTPTLLLSTCIDAGADVDKFLVLDVSNNVDYRTGAEVLSDIGAAASSHTHDDRYYTETEVDALGFVCRGNLSSYDWDHNDFTIDSAWHDLDLSSIVPAGAKAALLEVIILDGSASMAIQVKNKDHANDSNRLVQWTQAANIYVTASGICSCDSNRYVQYKIDTGMDEAYITVRGWFM